MSLIRKLKGTHLKQAKQILKLEKDIENGVFVVVDPSSKSCGVVIYDKMKEIYAEEIRATPTRPIGIRLAEMQRNLPVMDGREVVMLIEKVRSSTGHIYLTWSAGMLVSYFSPRKVVEVTTGAWKMSVDDTYIKSDLNDARAMGEFAIRLIRENK